MRPDKRELQDVPNRVLPRSDGLTEAQLANARAIYEDPVAYAEWRVRMGLAKQPDSRLDSVARARVDQRIKDLARQLTAQPKRREQQEREPAKPMTLEELSAHFAANPVKLSRGALKPGDAA